MDLQELAKRTDVPLRRLRHCLDEGLIPGLNIEIGEQEVGRRRKFHEDVGFAICCAAKLIEAGIDRSTVRVFMDRLVKLAFSDGSKLVLNAFFERQATGTAGLGDNVNMRIQFESPHPYDTGWVDPDDPSRISPGYRPLTVITLDIGQLASQVFGWGRKPN